MEEFVGAPEQDATPPSDCHVSQCCCQMRLADGSKQNRGVPCVDETQRGQVGQQGTLSLPVALPHRWKWSPPKRLGEEARVYAIAAGRQSKAVVES